MLRNKTLRAIAVFTTVLFFIPPVFNRHISREGFARNHEEPANNGSRRNAKTHLRLHVKPPKTLHVTEGDSEFLECQAGGTPSPVVYWLKNGKRLPQSKWENERSVSLFDDSGSDEDIHSKMDIGSTVSRLYLDCMSSDDEGEYTCVTENPYHRTSTTTQLFVSSSQDDNCQGKELYGQAPRIYSWTKTMLEKQGQQTKLICRADGDPKPTIEWLGTQSEKLSMEDITKYEVLPNGDLIIRDLKWNDMGNYICTAENVHGKAKVEIFVYPALPE